MPDLIVTNFNRNFTGVSATAAGVVRHQTHRYDMALAGFPLPGCPSPSTKSQAIQATRQPPVAHPFAIWHVRRNPEMRAAIWARDVLRCPIKIVFTSAAQRRHSAFPRWLINRMDAIIATTDMLLPLFQMFMRLSRMALIQMSFFQPKIELPIGRLRGIRANWHRDNRADTARKRH